MYDDMKELAQEMTKEEFILYVDKFNECPSSFGLIDDETRCDNNLEKCHECWNEAIEGIKFKEKEVKINVKSSNGVLN